MISEDMNINDIMDSHIHEYLSDEEVNLIHPIPTNEDAMRHIEDVKSYFTIIENVQDETFSLIYKIETAVNQYKNLYQTDFRDYLNKNFFSRSLQKRKNGVSQYIKPIGYFSTSSPEEACLKSVVCIYSSDAFGRMRRTLVPNGHSYYSFLSYMCVRSIYVRFFCTRGAFAEKLTVRIIAAVCHKYTSAHYGCADIFKTNRIRFSFCHATSLIN
jgi:hypothetical protein